MVAKIVRPLDRFWKYWPFLLPNMQMVALSTTTIRLKWVILFLSTLTLIFGMSTFCSNYSCTSLWHSVKIYPGTFNTNVIQCLLQLKLKLSFECTIDLSSYFPLAPNLLDEVEVWTLRGPVHRFQCSSRSLPSQVVPAIVCFMGIVMANSQKQLQPLKYCQFWPPLYIY